MNKDVIRSVNTVEEIGQRQFSEFVKDRLKSASNKPLSDNVFSLLTFRRRLPVRGSGSCRDLSIFIGQWPIPP